MKNPDLQKSLTESRARLETIAKSQGIALNIVQQPLMTQELRDFTLALAICPDDAAAERIAKKYAAAVAGFLFATRDIPGAFSSGRYTDYEIPEGGLTPYFYLARYVSSQIEMLDNFMRERRDKETH